MGDKMVTIKDILSVEKLVKFKAYKCGLDQDDCYQNFCLDVLTNVNKYDQDRGLVFTFLMLRLKSVTKKMIDKKIKYQSECELVSTNFYNNDSESIIDKINVDRFLKSIDKEQQEFLLFYAENGASETCKKFCISSKTITNRMAKIRCAIKI